MQDFTWIPSPWDDADPLFPVDWVAGWMRGGHRHGRARATALHEVHRRLSPMGVRTTALVFPQDQANAARASLWITHGVDRSWTAEAAGDRDEHWLRCTLSRFWSSPERHPPAQGPCLYHTDQAVVLDASGLGDRSALLVFRLTGAAGPLLDALMTQRAAWWVVLMLTGMLRGERYRENWQQITGLLVDGAQSPWRTAADQPVNPQEVTRALSHTTTAWVQRVAEVFEVATVSVFMPDPDDEYVFPLATHNAPRRAYDAGLVDKPMLESVDLGLTGSWAVSGTGAVRGAPLVRAIDTEADLQRHRQELGFEGSPDTQRSADDVGGPWLISVQTLPEDLSPTARNLVVQLEGRTVPDHWATDAERHRTSRDRRARLGMVSARLHTDALRLFREGLSRWRDGLRQTLLRELSSGEDLDGICQSIASWCSARVVSIWTHTDGTLTLAGWSHANTRPAVHHDARNPVDARELRLLHAPLYPSALHIGEDGFLGLDSWRSLVGHTAENTATLPIQRGGRTVALLRVEAALSLFAGLIPRNGPQGALNSHRPTATPRHLRPALEETAQLLALVLESSSAPQSPDWDRFLSRVRGHHLSNTDARAYLEALHQRAPTRGQAAMAVGVHRNTFRRHLNELQDHLGDDLPW